MKFIAIVGIVSAIQLQSQTPDESREIFEKHRQEAAKLVADQQAFETTKVADVETRNQSDTKQANDLKNKVKLARDQNMMGYTNQNQTKQQWTGPESLEQIPNFALW